MAGDDTRLRILSRGLLAATLLAMPLVEIAAAAVGAAGPWAALNTNLFTQFACTGIYAIYWSQEPDPTRRYHSAIIGALAVLAALLAALTGLAVVPVLRSPLAAIGIVGLGFIVHGAIALPEPVRSRWRMSLVPALFLPMAVALAPFFLWLSGQVNPVLDMYILAFEDTLGLRPSAMAFELLTAIPVIAAITKICYLALPLGIAAVYALQRPEHIEADIILAFAIATILGFGVYFVFPAIGPPPLFGESYPDNLPAIGTVVAGGVDAQAQWPRNNMPSLHTVWALLIWFNVRHFGGLPRRLMRAFVAANIAATMGPVGGHWITDLVVAVPFAVAVQALCSATRPLHDNARRVAVVSGFALALAWLAALRWGTDAFEAVPGLSWLAIAATLGASIALERSVRPVPLPVSADIRIRPT